MRFTNVLQMQRLARLKRLLLTAVYSYHSNRNLGWSGVQGECMITAMQTTFANRFCCTVVRMGIRDTLRVHDTISKILTAETLEGSFRITDHT